MVSGSNPRFNSFMKSVRTTYIITFSFQRCKHWRPNYDRISSYFWLSPCNKKLNSSPFTHSWSLLLCSESRCFRNRWWHHWNLFIKMPFTPNRIWFGRKSRPTILLCWRYIFMYMMNVNNSSFRKKKFETKLSLFVPSAATFHSEKVLSQVSCYNTSQTTEQNTRLQVEHIHV